MTTTVAIAGSTPAHQTAPEGHDAAMAAKFEAAQSGQTTPAAGSTPAQGELIAGKFKSNDELLKAYLELQGKLGAPKDPPATTTPATTVKSPATDGTVTEPPAVTGKDGLTIDPAKAAEAATTQAGLDMAALTAEYTEKGDLSDEAYAKLAAVGISKQMVADYADGQKVRAAQYRSTLLTDSGVKSEDNFAAMIGWAATSLSKDEIAAYNAAVSPGQPQGVQKLAVEAMFNRFTRAQGSDPKLLTGGTRASVSGDSYESQEQWKADMRDPRYSADPAFRNKVIAKLGRSNI
jgi:hypothetical protein